MSSVPLLRGALVASLLLACGGPAAPAPASSSPAQGGGDPEPTAAPEPPRELPGGLGTLLVSASDAPRYYAVHGFSEPDGYFSPTDAEAEAASTALDGALAAVREDGPADAQGYYRHLLGVVRAGRRQVFVAGFCEVHGDGGWTEPQSVSDGGACYFEGYYDLTSRAFVDLRFHGEA